MAGLDFKALQKNQDWYSQAVSKGVRSTAFGIIAATWVVFTAEGIELLANGLLGVPTAVLVRLAFILASAVLIVDVLQYISALWMTSIGMDRWDKRESAGEKVEFYYDLDNLGWFGLALYWLNFGLFPIKLILAIAGGLSFFFFAFAITVT